MTTQKILSTITLCSLNFLPLHHALASQDRAVFASVSTPTQREPRPSFPTPPASEEQPVAPPPSKRPLAIGFAESPQLQALLRNKLTAAGRYALAESPQIPVSGLG